MSTTAAGALALATANGDKIAGLLLQVDEQYRGNCLQRAADTVALAPRQMFLNDVLRFAARHYGVKK